jgi:hypothetical protein
MDNNSKIEEMTSSTLACSHLPFAFSVYEQSSRTAQACSTFGHRVWSAGLYPDAGASLPPS